MGRIPDLDRELRKRKKCLIDPEGAPWRWEARAGKWGKGFKMRD